MSKTLQEAGTQVQVADVVYHGDKLTLPVGMAIPAAISLLERRQSYLEEEMVISDTFDVFPWDGAYGLQQIIAAKYGWVDQRPTPGFFGPKPPQMINVEIAPNKFATVPWGRMGLPGVDGYLQTNSNRKDGRIVFAMGACVKRKDEATIRVLFDALREYLKTNSIYRGQAIKLRFRDDNGDLLDMPEPKFMDTTVIDDQMLIYSDSVKAQVETNLFTPIRRVKDCLANSIPVKRGVLLGGTYGTGKTLAATVASKYAVESGITYLYIPRADELADAIEFGKIYQSPACVIFVEDIDREMGGERSVAMDDILNIIDGIDTKSANIITVLTTNNLNGIHPAMLRPGRLDAVIEVSPPDAKAVQALLRAYGNTAVSPDTDLTAVGEKLAGNIPAVIAEVVKRAKLAQLRLQAHGTQVTHLTSEALLEAAESMVLQLNLLKGPKVDTPPTLQGLMQEVVADALNGAKENIAHTRKQVDEIHRAVN